MNKIIETLQNMKNNYKVINNLMYLLKWLNFILLCIIFTLPYYNFLNGTIIGRLPVFNERLQSLLSANVFIYGFIGLGVAGLLMVLKKSCIDFSVEKNYSKIMIIYNISADLAELIYILFFLIKFINDILCYLNGIAIFSTQNQYFYIIYFLYCAYLFLAFLYSKYEIFWHYADKNYLPYFDSEGIQIAEEDKVIFYGCLYKVIYEANETIIPREWYLIKDNGFSSARRKGPLLEDAVKDKDGKITIFSPSKNRKETW